MPRLQHGRCTGEVGGDTDCPASSGVRATLNDGFLASGSKDGRALKGVMLEMTALATHPSPHTRTRPCAQVRMSGPSPGNHRRAPGPYLSKLGEPLP